MSKFAFVGDQQQATSLKVQRAFDAGRAASVAAANISTNPHVSNTPEWVAWRNGHVTYASNGANTLPDGPAEPAKFANPAVTIANVDTDTTGATKKATPAAPGLPFRIDWGDGTWDDNPAASTTAINHTYAEGGVYATRLLFAGAQWDAEDVTVTIGAIDMPATVDLDEATDSVLATYTENGVGVESEELTLTSSDTDVFTVDATVVTAADGVATITLTRVADGEATLTVETATGLTAVADVTVSGLGVIDLVATKALDAATADVVATFTMDGDPVNDEELTLTSSDTDMFTVDATATTDESGEATITLTRVGNGVANLTVEASTGKTAVCVVTVSGVE